jgi:Putative beta-barrel porin-2, OmpL-like. bbp2
MRTAVVCVALVSTALAGRGVDAAIAQEPPSPAATTQNSEQPAATWQLGAFADAAYAKDFNSPANHLFRSRGTTPRVDETDMNMAAVYVRKSTSPTSRWGFEATGQAGQDSNAFGFSPTAPNVSGGEWLRHLGPTNVSYLAPAGGGVTVQAGIFSSLIGYDSLYSKDNFSYTRPWGADFTPYLMLGVNAGYPVSPNVTATAFVVNGYFHLAHANDVPSFGGQVAYKTNERVTIKETLLYGPHQSNTSLSFWRMLSDTIVERKTSAVTTAFEFQLGTENVDRPTTARAWWTSAQLPVHVNVRAPLSITIRPEFCVDSEGRWTGFEQTVEAITSTVEYRARFHQTQAIVRGEYRYDHSTGSSGGFYTDGEVEPGVVGLTPGQHLLTISVVLTAEWTAASRD